MTRRRVLARLTELLRRDPTDGDVAFLVSVSSREPCVVYESERRRLRRLTRSSSSPRSEILAQAAQLLLDIATGDG